MQPTADIIFYNGRIYTSADSEPVSCLLVRGERILQAGSLTRGECRSYADEHTRFYDLGGKTVLPAFLDAHTHPVCIALTDWRVPLGNTQNLTELLEAAARFCREHSPEEVPYFLGESYDTTMFDEKGPRKELLDRYVSDRPARLQDFTDHSCWYNSRALELMGIVKGQPDPESIAGTPAVIVRDPDGEPTGWVLEMPTDILERPMYDRIGWHPAEHATAESIRPFLDYLTACGVCGLEDGFTEGEEAIRLFYELDQSGQFPFYYESMVLLPEYEALDETIRLLRSWQQKYTTKHIRIGCVKFFLDGTNELGDCASLEPLCTDPTGTDYGHINMETPELTRVMLRLNEEGIDFHMHIVGDRAFRTACDALERAKREAVVPWVIRVTAAHCELVHPADRRRPGELGMIIDWTPHWSGGYFGEKARDYLGQERFDRMYDFTEIREAGAVLAMSSDVFSYKEANRANPFFGIGCGMTRIDPEFPLNPERFPGSVRPPESAKMPFSVLLEGYTRGAAYQMRREDCLGTLDGGKLANFLILEEDPHEMEPERLERLQPDEVWFEGRRIKSKTAS